MARSVRIAARSPKVSRWKSTTTRAARLRWIAHQNPWNGGGNDAAFDDLYLGFAALAEALHLYGDVTIEMAKTDRNWASIALAALDAKPIAESKKILLVAVEEAEFG